MEFLNSIELHEAIYLFQKLMTDNDHQLEPIEFKAGILNDSICKAVARILVANNLLEESDHSYHQSISNIENQDAIVESTYYMKNRTKLDGFFSKAIDLSYNFFTHLNDLEYDTYSRWDFEVTHKIGEKVAEYLKLSNCKVLELGGNSGGLATAIVRKDGTCTYTIIDTHIPCHVGNELKRVTNTDIAFIEGNIFDLNLSCQVYDCIILMNLLHDFDDNESIKVLENAKKYSDEKTKIVIIEDILLTDYQPKEVIMQGLRLSVECKGGRQRTLEEMSVLLSTVGYQLEEEVNINHFHTMLTFGYAQSLTFESGDET